MKRTIPTTTLKVVKPEDYSALGATFHLIRYELPKDLRWRMKSAPFLYGQVHNILRDQLDCPYKAYMYDQLDNGVIKWVVYALYPKNATPVILEMPFSSTAPLAPQKIVFEQLPLHVLLKLLQITFVRGYQASRFVGQDHCYVHAKKVGPFSHICLRIDLKGDTRTQQTDSEQEFKVNGHACLFRRVGYPEGSFPSYMYFGRKITQNRVHFLHLKRAEIEAVKQRNEPLYGIGTRNGKKTTLAYHDLRNIEGSTGKLLADFIQDFTAFLAQYGIVCRTKERQFSRFVPPKQPVQVLLSLLNTVAVYDNRLNRTHTLQDYLRLFGKFIPDVRFVELTDFSQWNKRAVLVLQDYNKEDFEEGKPLEGRTDPYSSLYRATPYIPKQSLNVNVTENEEDEEEDDDDEDTDDIEDVDDVADTENGEAADYLLYTLPGPDDKAFNRNLQVALTQLYLKEVICLERSVQQWLPLAPTDFLFLRKARYIAGHDAYVTALLFEHDALRFLDLRDPDQKDQLRKVCAQFGVDWENMEDQLLRKYWKREDGEKDQELSHYDIIIGPGLFVELEDAEERILYDYTEIVRRQEAMKTNLPVEDFKLLSYYDVVRPMSFLSRKDVQDRLLLQDDAQPRSDTETESLTLYRQLEEFDAFLDEVQQSHATISFRHLFDGEFMKHIARIFHLRPDKKGKYSRRRLKGYYQKRGWFLSDKAKDVQMYEGIWYDDERCYTVGSAQPMNQQQPRAHLIRRFDVYQGADSFDIEPFLLSMGVQFVRRNQYTVYPYPFHLIDLYVENVLRYQ